MDGVIYQYFNILKIFGIQFKKFKKYVIILLLQINQINKINHNKVNQINWILNLIQILLKLHSNNFKHKIWITNLIFLNK